MTTQPDDLAPMTVPEILKELEKATNQSDSGCDTRGAYPAIHFKRHFVAFTELHPQMSE